MRSGWWKPAPIGGSLLELSFVPFLLVLYVYIYIYNSQWDYEISFIFQLAVT